MGSYGNYWKLKNANWSNVENGIESKYINDAAVNKTFNGKLEFCFVGRYAKHQNIECLVEAMDYIKNKHVIKLHFIGTGLENIAKNISKKDIEVINHGYLNRDALLNVLNQSHVGLICGTPPYQSCMKLHDYALTSCLVLAPMVNNLKIRFENSLLFFDRTTIPEESYPRYSSRFKPSNSSLVISKFVIPPTIPHIKLS